MHDDWMLREFESPSSEGGVAEIAFLLAPPAIVVEATEHEFANDFDAPDLDARVASVGLRRWQARAAEDVTLIERLADADFAISYHLEPGPASTRDGSISVNASMWFPSIEEADATLHAFGAQGRTASFTSADSAARLTRFVVGLVGIQL